MFFDANVRESLQIICIFGDISISRFFAPQKLRIQRGVVGSRVVEQGSGGKIIPYVCKMT